MAKPRLTVVDDESEILDLVGKAAEGLGFDVCKAASGKQMMKALADEPPDVIVLDMIMPDLDGIEILQELAARESGASIILMTGYQEQYLTMANKLGSAKGLNILGALTKPFRLEQLEQLLRKGYSGN